MNGKLTVDRPQHRHLPNAESSGPAALPQATRGALLPWPLSEAMKRVKILGASGTDHSTIASPVLLLESGPSGCLLDTWPSPLFSLGGEP